MKCTCKEWQENLPKVEEPRMREHARTGCSDYDGVPFRFCPWCGYRLQESMILPLGVVTNDLL